VDASLNNVDSSGVWLSMSNVDRLRRGYDLAAKRLLADANPAGAWTGELSSSPLSTATAVVALQLVRRHQLQRTAEFEPLISNGLKWLSECQNPDGGWGDTELSHSNISTTTLVYSSFHLVGSVDQYREYKDISARAKEYIERQGGFEAIKKRYGKDHTFSVPILTQCALAGLVPWEQLPPLPFELGCFPPWFYRWVSLPVVSYALPALIAIGQVRHHLAPSRNPLIRLIRQAAVAPTLRRLQSIQPESGGFLEATPLTSFVTMSLAAMGQSDHPVARLGVDFLKASVRSDGSWPIDTNLATWVTTLSANALRPESLTKSQSAVITDFLLKQQHRIVHRYTNAAPGGWAWTDLSGGVPDADDTPGAILALLKLDSENPELPCALEAAVKGCSIYRIEMAAGQRSVEVGAHYHLIAVPPT
jgi:squalene-hopene/tetraprenyl-beta-curcumene cyclase